MYSQDEVLTKFVELSCYGIKTISNRMLESITGKIRFFYDNENKELLHLKNITGITPMTNINNIAFRKVYQGIVVDRNPVIDIKNRNDTSVVFCTHGTIFNKKNTKNQYLWDEQIKLNSDKFTKDIASFLNCKYGAYCKWSGENNHRARVEAAEEIFLGILSVLYDISKDENIIPEQIPVTLLGHSHGGNVMLLVSEKLISSGFTINALVTTNTPVRPEYRLRSSIKHINLFSFIDWVQIFGGWDFDLAFYDKDFLGPAKRLFKNAINICIDSKINLADREAFIEIKRKIPSIICLQHNITRWSKFLIKCLEG